MAAKRRYNPHPHPQLAKVKAQEKLEPAAATGAPKAPTPNAVGCLWGAGITASQEQTCKTGTFLISCLLSLFCYNIEAVGSWEPSGSLGEIFLSWCRQALSWLGPIICFSCMRAQPVRTYMNVRKSFGNSLFTGLDPNYSWLLSSSKRLRSSHLSSETIGEAEREGCSYL